MMMHGLVNVKHFTAAIKIYFNICFFYLVDKFLIFREDL